MKTGKTILAILGMLSLLLVTTVPVFADSGQIITLQTRPNVSISFYYMKQDKASATVILLPGGKGDIDLKDGSPDSEDFLVRSREYFFANGFNVAIVDKSDDVDELKFQARISSQHSDDINQIADYVKEDGRLPVWLVGTSRGTISATAAAVAMETDSLSGIVLTSSITSTAIPGAVPTQNLSKIRVPVLVVHHEEDSCRICDPNEIPDIMDGLYNSPIKKAVLVKGGGWARGNTCGPRHRHGYVGMEEQVVTLISHWIQNPAF